MLDDDSLNGWAVIVIGAMLTTLCGTCTYSAASGSGDELNQLALIVGGVPTVFGAWLLASGIRRVWAARRRR